MSDTKMIRVVSRGFVFTSRGRVMSPIMSPYRESINRIWNMITVDRADVEEKLDDGSFVPLTVQNYDKDNNIKADIATGVPVKVTKEPSVIENNTNTDDPETSANFLSIETESVEEHKDEVPADDGLHDLENSEEDVEETEESSNPNQNFSNNRNKKKRNRNRNNNQNVTGSDLAVPTESVE